jgi:Tyrosine phosphatase family
MFKEVSMPRHTPPTPYSPNALTLFYRHALAAVRCGALIALCASPIANAQTAITPSTLPATMVATLATPTASTCAHPLDAAIPNGCVVNEQTLWRGAKPDAFAAAKLLTTGVKTVVSLELMHNDLNAFETADLPAGAAGNVKYFQIREWEPLVVIAPSLVDRHVAQFIAITRTQPTPIYVHCRAGQNRTGIMVAAFKIFNGADIEATIKDMASYGGIWAKQDAAYLRRLTPQFRAALEPKIRLWIDKIKPSAQIACAQGRCTVDKL